MAEEIKIEFTRFSAFYSPLIATMAGGFLKEEGLVGKHSVSPPGKSAIASVVDGSVHVGQSAPSQGFAPLEKGKKPPAVHFAQINEKDGFFIAGRQADKAFTWDKLKGRKVIVDHGGQPMAMFKYACFKKGVDVEEPVADRRRLHREHDRRLPQGRGRLCASAGSRTRSSSSTTASATSLPRSPMPAASAPSRASPRRATGSATDMAKAFMRAYRKSRAWLIATPAAEVAKAEASFFKDIDQPVLTQTIATYQKLGNWTPHVEITKPAFEAALDIFLHAGLITKRHAYEDIVVRAAGVGVGRNRRKPHCAEWRKIAGFNRRNTPRLIAPYSARTRRHR